MKECKFCGSGEVFVKKKLLSPINAKKYSLYTCKKCKSAFFDVNEHKVDLQTMYDNFVDRANFPVEFIPSKKWINEKKMVQKLLKKVPNSVLDVGCRTGDFLMHFEKNIVREGVELSTNFSKIAHQRGLKVHNDFLEKVQFDSSFDLVTCYAILEHLEYPLTFLESLISVINKDGLLVIMIPYHSSLKEKLISMCGKQWHMYSPPEHLNFYSSKFLDNYLKKMGFEKVYRKFQAGGMRSFKKGILSEIENITVQLIDKSFCSRFPIYDHMYSYYIKK